jgi:hypothetical protein
MISTDVSRASAHNSRGKPALRPWRRQRAQPPVLSLISSVFALVALGGCSLSDGVSPYITDPGRFSVYHCKDLVERLKVITTRENELRELMNKASDGGGGSVIGALSYGPDYEKQLGDEKVLRRTAAEKKCALEPPAFESDQSIR